MGLFAKYRMDREQQEIAAWLESFGASQWKADEDFIEAEYVVLHEEEPQQQIMLTTDILARNRRGETIFVTARNLRLAPSTVQTILHRAFVRIAEAGYWQSFEDGDLI